MQFNPQKVVDLFVSYFKTTEICVVKKITFILALLMLLKPIIPVVEYVVFYDYIKTELCENKSKPELKCNGKCHLMKQMANATDTPENGKDKKQVSVESQVVFCQAIFSNMISPLVVYPISNADHSNSNYNLSYSYLEIESIFRPPIA